MKYRNTMILVGSSLLLGLTSIQVIAAPDKEAVSQAETVESRVQLEIEYERAISMAKEERQAAEASLERAREQLQRINEQKQLVTEQSQRERAEVQAEMSRMHEELNQSHRQLQETSREIARVNREISRVHSGRHTTSYSYSVSDRPVIGVILGDADDVGVEVLGVSPDGPSERAGIMQGDIIIAVGGRVLGAIEESDNARDGLQRAMREVKADEPLIVSVERGEQTLDLTVIPEVREPMTWQTVTRFPSISTTAKVVTAPNAPSQVITIERIEVPEIDTVQMAEQIERMRADIDQRRAAREVHRVAPVDREYEFEFHELSELGNLALQDANVWFGLPVARGLQLAEIEPALGAYFKTDRGVLVLKAREDNDLQLETGDVILQVGESEVNSPADFMRALRGLDSGEEFEIEIKRNRKDRTLTSSIPENRSSFFNFDSGEPHTFTVISH